MLEHGFRFVCDLETGRVIDEEHFVGINVEERDGLSLMVASLFDRRRFRDEIDYQKALSLAREES